MAQPIDQDVLAPSLLAPSASAPLTRRQTTRARHAPKRFADLISTDELDDETIDREAEEAASSRKKRRVSKVRKGVEQVDNQDVVKNVKNAVDDNSENKKNAGEDGYIPVDELVKGDIVSTNKYYQIKGVLPRDPRYRGRRFYAHELRAVPGQDSNWTFTIGEQFSARSASRVLRTVHVNKTELAEQFTNVGTKVFTLKFRTVFNDDSLLKDLVKNKDKGLTDLVNAEGEDDINDKAKKLVQQFNQAHERTIVARMITPGRVIGDSLVDELAGFDGRVKPDDVDTSRNRYLTVQHRGLLELIVDDTKYVLKK